MVLLPRPRRRGRKPSLLSAGQRLQIMQLLREHPAWGLPRLRQAIRDLPRNAAAVFVRSFQRTVRRHRRRRWRRLVWHVPGAVWAIDGTWMDQAVDGRSRRALIAVELHDRKVLALEAVPGERAASAVALLRRLIDRHGAPLVLKADNGSAFTAACLAQLCRGHGIVLMHSPVRRPRWNGTCEVSGRWAKARASAAASARGSPTLSQCDLDAAVTVGQPLPTLDADLRRHFAATFQRERLRVAVERGLAFVAAPQDHVRRSLERVAAQRALLQCHILTIEGRELPQCLPGRRA
jgi:transposase InsO family protein